MAEVRNAGLQLKCGKAPGQDAVYTEYLKNMGDEGFQRLTELCNGINDTVITPQDTNRSSFLPIPKKTNASECKDFRTISLMSHVLKVLLKVIENRLKPHIENQLPEEQYGFRSGVGTRDAILCLRNICERSIEMSQDVYICFIDYEKAFDRVNHNKLMETLHDIGIDGKDLRLLGNLYWDQEAGMSINGKVSTWSKIERGVRQGCVLSPGLFNVYSEMVLRNIQDLPGISVGGRFINNVRYADDTALIADSSVNLQVLLDKVVAAGADFGLKINVKKTKSMVVSKYNPSPTLSLNVGMESIEQVRSFVYLGALITEDARSDQEVKRRIAIAKSAFNSIRNLVCNRSLSFCTRLRMVKCYVYSTFCYSAETWTMNKTARNKINAFEMWTIRRMQKISYTDYKSNKAVLEGVGLTPSLLREIAKRKLKFFGHTIRHQGLLSNVICGKIPGRRSRGRQRLTWINNIKDWTGLKSIGSLVNTSRDRTRWRSITVNPRLEDDT